MMSETTINTVVSFNLKDSFTDSWLASIYYFLIELRIKHRSTTKKVAIAKHVITVLVELIHVVWLRQCCCSLLDRLSS